MKTGVVDTQAIWRAARISALCIGLAGMLLGVFAAASGWEQHTVQAAWWTASAVSLVSGLPLTLCVASRRGSLRQLRWISGLYAASCLAALVTWPVASGLGGLPEGEIPWLSDVLIVAIGAAAYAWPARMAFGYAIVLAIVRGLVRYDSTGGNVGATIAIQDALFTVALGTFVIIAVLVVRRGAARQDAAADEARDAAKTAAAKQAYASERAHMDALVHDAVMSTLSVAARGETETALREPLARQAELTVRELEALREPRGPDQPMPAADVVAQIETAVTAVDPAIPVRSCVSGDPIVFSTVCRTLAEATGEAVRNSVRHADVPGRAVSRSVLIVVGASQIRVEVRDDGAGFQPHKVPDSRLGLSLSIQRRLSQIVRGRARVESHPGHGTAVVLEWSPPGSFVDQFPATDFRAWFGRAEAAVVTGIFIGIHTTLAIVNSDVLRNRWPTFLSLSLIAACAICLCVVLSHPLSRSVTAAVVVLAPLTAALISWQLPNQGWPGYAAWHVGANTFLLCVVAARGRAGWAWLGYAALAAVTITWAGTQVQDIGMGLELSAPHAPTMLVATMIGVALTRAMTKAGEHHREHTLSVAAAAADESRQRERDRRLAYLDSTARPMLERVAQSSVLDNGERQDCLRLEAQLRDWIRGGALSAGPVLAAAQRARIRGVDVTLIDDGSGSDHEGSVGELIRARVAAELDQVGNGRVVARVQPPGRPSLVTVVVETSGSHRRLEIDHLGNPITSEAQLDNSPFR